MSYVQRVKRLRQIISTLLVVFLTLVTGMGGSAHAMLGNCPGGHCDDHMLASVNDRHAGHALVTSAADVPQQQDLVDHEGCNPFLCNVLAFTSQHSDAGFDQSGAALTWFSKRLSALEEPSSPDRPPNL